MMLDLNMLCSCMTNRDLFIAGIDTSSSSLVWTMVELIRNPRAMKIAQDEVRRIIGTKEMVQESDLHQLNYLQVVVKESLRLHPPAPLLLPRETTEKCIVGGYEIPAKTRVLVNATAIGMDRKYWESPEEFLPERFIDNPIDYRGQDFEFIPFGIGRRGCPGLQFAIPVIELVLANLLHCFDWELLQKVKRKDVNMTEAVYGAVMSYARVGVWGLTEKWIMATRGGRGTLVNHTRALHDIIGGDQNVAQEEQEIQENQDQGIQEEQIVQYPPNLGGQALNENPEAPPFKIILNKKGLR
ncbi:cytochrome P450 71A9-like [Tasmannia lanceolata]|uniref:cytochrome P450 71A9-like n=1 Tax=Tasmannia lanceolata TaxID=3420 RepID=UPI004064B3DA